MFEVNRVGVLHFATAESFHQLSHRQNACGGVGMEYVEGALRSISKAGMRQSMAVSGMYDE